VDASHGTQVELPEPKAILPYLGLFTMLTINPTEVTGFRIPTLHLPSLSILCGTKFVKATSATAEKVPRVFEPSALDDNTPLNLVVILLSRFMGSVTGSSQFPQRLSFQRYSNDLHMMPEAADRVVVMGQVLAMGQRVAVGQEEVIGTCLRRRMRVVKVVHLLTKVIRLEKHQVATGLEIMVNSVKRVVS
jgi:hypothetical protein